MTLGPLRSNSFSWRTGRVTTLGCCTRAGGVLSFCLSCLGCKVLSLDALYAKELHTNSGFAVPFKHHTNRWKTLSCSSPEGLIFQIPSKREHSSRLETTLRPDHHTPTTGVSQKQLPVVLRGHRKLRFSFLAFVEIYWILRFTWVGSYFMHFICIWIYTLDKNICKEDNEHVDTLSS